ncbi:serine-threonine protein kinase, putative [Theileria annulata]|uniref:Serine-threonine protein kinase, putative n=1 Tax=Theileria annulata TaxID=5874 RepID=Q4UGZ0_THEAN|nr:serine-threonine protein kinase, putative [Theileria annulata]CAI73649.1 serine-threonine protein kinase, putative [Theileria annulata]|eukprot:XP_954326.1 serine-threonine protein kinase, putative [Theileria annulata]
MDILKNNQGAQIEEIYSLHCIYYPVKILNYGGLRPDKFPHDCMSECAYTSLLENSKFLTNIKVNESAIKGAVRSELLRFCFKISPFIPTELSNSVYSLVDVTFPKLYPNKPPFIVLKMTISMHNDLKKKLKVNLTKEINRLAGQHCLFEISIFLIDFLAKVNSDREILFEDSTAREFTQDYKSVSSDSSESSNSSNSSVTNTNNDTNTDLNKTGYTNSENMLEESVDNLVVGVNKQHKDIEFPIWSIQSIVQAPIWYENLEENQEISSDLEREKETKAVNKGGSTKKQTSRAVISEIRSQSSIRSKESEDQKIHSVTNIELYFTLETVVNLKLIKKLLLEYTGDTYFRFQRDFTSVETVNSSIASSLLSVKHVLDQNLYYIKAFHLPSLCPYTNLSEVNMNSSLHVFRVKQRMILNEIISRVSHLSKLEHNSLCRYYQSWLEKKPEPNISNYFINKIDTFLKSSSFSSLYNTNTNTNIIDQVDTVNSGSSVESGWNELLILLLKYFPELGEHYLHEIVTERNLYVQAQNINCHTLRYEIENNALCKDEKLIWLFIRQLLDVLAYLHQNNVHHQSLSLDNIYVHNNLYGTGRGLKVSEFGITGLARKLLTLENECNRKFCDCKKYKRDLKNQLYLSHPSNYNLTSTTLSNFNSDIHSRLYSIEYDNLNITNTNAINNIDGTSFNLENSLLLLSNELKGSLLNNGMAGMSSVLSSIKSSELDHLEFEHNLDQMAAVQEDMFALGLIIFSMWHPPIEESALHELLSRVIGMQTFPDYFIQTTPSIIITTLKRLLTRERRPTAVELLRETLVPPVVDIYMYKQYLRKLENPHSEESLDALKFLMNRDWKSDVSKYKHDSTLETMTHNSYIIGTLERFMRSRGVIIRPPLPLQVKTPDNNDMLLGIDESNTVFSVGGSIRQSLLKSFELYSGDDSGIGVKQFSVGDVFNEENCVTECVFSITMKIEGDSGFTKSAGKKSLDYKELDDNCILMVSTQVDLILIAIQSVLSLNFSLETFLTITFQPLIVDFLCIVLETKAEVASEIFLKLQSTDINEYTFNVLLEEYSIDKIGQLKGLVDLLSGRFNIILGLKKLHYHVLNSKIPKIYQNDFKTLYQQLAQLETDFSIESNNLNGENTNFSSEITNHNGDKEFESNIEIQGINEFEKYFKRMLYMIEFAIMLRKLSLDSYCCIECVLGVYYTEVCEFNTNFPFFHLFVVDDRKNLVMTGGCYGTNLSFLEPSNVSKVVHFDLQYFLDDLIKLSVKHSAGVEGFTVTPTVSDTVDVVITCQTAKLLPVATSIANKLIDAGISCECRAVPLILTSDFNYRLRTIKSIKARVHLQKSSNITEDTVDTLKISQSQVEKAKTAQTNTENDISEDEEDKTHHGILYHVEPINGSFGQARKIYNEVALVHFIIGQLT